MGLACLRYVRSLARAVNAVRLRPWLLILIPAYMNNFENCFGFNIALIVASVPIFCGDSFSLERIQKETHTYGNCP